MRDSVTVWSAAPLLPIKGAQNEFHEHID
jgi:hypothetical protein